MNLFLNLTDQTFISDPSGFSLSVPPMGTDAGSGLAPVYFSLTQGVLGLSPNPYEVDDDLLPKLSAVDEENPLLWVLTPVVGLLPNRFAKCFCIPVGEFFLVALVKGLIYVPHPETGELVEHCVGIMSPEGNGFYSDAPLQTFTPQTLTSAPWHNPRYYAPLSLYAFSCHLNHLDGSVRVSAFNNYPLSRQMKETVRRSDALVSAQNLLTAFKGVVC